MQPVTNIQLETSRLILRTMLPTDFDDLYRIFTDPNVMASFDAELFSPAEMDGWLQRNLAHQAKFGYGLFSVILKESGCLIGDCGLEQMDVDGVQAAELGYDLRSDFWGRGYATEAAGCVRNYALDTLKLSRLISLIRVGNTASRRVAEKVGMHLAAQITRYGIAYWEYALERPN